MKESKAILLIQKVSSSNHSDWMKNLMEIISVTNKLFFDRTKRINTFDNERTHLSNLLLQKITLHGSSILNCGDGINFPSDFTKDFKIMDPFSLSVLMRSLLECYLTLHHINFAPTEKENDIRFKIWTMYGLSQRAKMTFVTMPKEILAQLDYEKEENENLRKEICNSDLFLNLDENKQKTLSKQITQDWKFTFRNETYIKCSWQELLNNTGVNQILFNDTYNFLSWFAHSSSISLYQLRDIYRENRDKDEVKNVLKEAAIIVALAITDYIKIENETKKEFDKLSKDKKDLINIYNYIYRNESYCIDFEKE
ncbi:MAG: hypothetical protein K9H64_20660 [Bacteroidales bacterium]|nr:hypothetical protein [Bacteroidales bacterium]MCF8458732.1 hypothetical protein [Bacteroidales bacterium]